MTSVDAYIDDLEAESRAIRSEESEDLDRMRECKGAMNQGMSVHLIALNSIASAHADTNLFQRMVSSDGFDLPVEEVAGIAGDAFLDRVEGFRERYCLENVAALLERLPDALDSVSDEKTFIDLVRKLRAYLNHLQFQIAARIPFHELSVAFEGRRVIDEEYYAGVRTRE